ncbi:SDR family oxidoreductase [Vibrio sp. MEBiC08052]|uniref:SDR family oxidoreductase n=1 Tax=Vibrio sp. MEBiC08052 TaxID=1761910 RepID=UPI00074072D8|nr:SDR family oxidoreductase [Vibrio sp. MEBiC08052]KUI99674.1 acetoacetyl-CoA reductase [Vibrio sp. MEBiC08052]
MSKLALITGATGGIGSAIVKELLSKEYYVIGTYYGESEEKIHQWASENDLSLEKIKLLNLDVSNFEMCKETLNNLMNTYGDIDVLINCAGITRDKLFKKMEKPDWYDVINTNLNSVFNITQCLFPAMLNKGYGKIINISSVNGLKGQFGQTNYSAAKAGMIGFTKALALEGAKYGVTVNAIAPGYTATPMVAKMREDLLESIKTEIPMRRLATPKDIAGAVAYLISDAGTYITGETLSVNGGLYMH